MDLVTVKKVDGWHCVFDHNGEHLTGYRMKKHAESFALGHVSFIYGEAEEYNRRRDYALAYLASRAKRTVKPKAQFELF